jgi:hypothetical protein
MEKTLQENVILQQKIQIYMNEKEQVVKRTQDE